VTDEEKVLHIQAKLAEPFSPLQTHYKPQATNNNRCLPVAYIDARDVQDRLDDVMGIDGWRDEYDVIPGVLNVVCKLWLKIPGQGWIAKYGNGAQSAQKDEGDRIKSAFSDALKIAAVKWGISRNLYRMKLPWVDYDPNKKQITDESKFAPAIQRAMLAHQAKYPSVYAKTSLDKAPLVTDYVTQYEKNHPKQTHDDPGEPVISDLQADTLRALFVTIASTDEKTVLARYSEVLGRTLSSIDELPERFFEQCKNRLQQIKSSESEVNRQNPSRASA